MDIRLNPDEVRVLGCLIEKRLSTPASYPLTLNSLVNACNQSSNRDPVVEFDQHVVNDALINTRQQDLSTRLSSAGSRAAKFEEKLCERLGLNQAGSALLAELMLRGPQTPGELRQRSSRMHSFDELSQVERVLERLTEQQLIVVLPKQPGKREARYAHLLCGPHVEPHQSVSTVAATHGEDKELTLAQRVQVLEEQVGALTRRLEDLEQAGSSRH